MKFINEDIGSEQPAIQIFKDKLGYNYNHGFDISPLGKTPLRTNFDEVILVPLLKDALVKINGDITDKEFEEVYYQITRTPSTSLVQNNKHFLDLIKRGVIINEENSEESRHIKLIDFNNPSNNDYMISNQFTIKNTENNIRPDLIVFLNGLPISILEFKNPNDENATLYTGYKKNIQKYKKLFPELFYYNQINILADDNNALSGSMTATFSYYFPWRTMERKYPSNHSEQEILIREMFNKETLLDILDNFIVFEDDSKILTMYQQYYTVNEALNKTITDRDGRIGVVWHTQGSGKSFSMVFYVNKLRKCPELEVPTILIVTDRDELDDQITKTFSKSLFSKFKDSDLRAKSITDLRKKLENLPQGGVFFTLIQKFQQLRNYDRKNKKVKILEKEHPLLNNRKNIIVIVDEAHRTQYNKMHRNMKRALPNAHFIGFTGTPIEVDAERDTRSTFGDFIGVPYTVTDSEKDKNTVPIFYDGRKAELNIDTKELDKLFEDYIKNYKEEEKEKFRRKWGKLEVLLGDSKRIKAIAKDLVFHFNNRKIKGKAMLVAVNRKTAVKYKEIIEKIPGAPSVGIVISGNEKKWKEKGYIHDPKDLIKIRDDFKELEKEPELMIVCDMLLTGYSASCLTTLYLDKPMKNHTLFQAVARVNRVFKDKPSGLIVDYIGMADRINEALDKYSKKNRTDMLKQIEVAIELMNRRYGQILKKVPSLEFKEWETGDSLLLSRVRKKVLNDILKSKKNKMEFLKESLELKKLFAIVSPRKEALSIEFEVDVIESLRVSILKMGSVNVGEVEIEDSVIENLISNKLKVDGIKDIVNIQGSKEVLLTSEEFMDSVKKDTKNENLQVELLKKILNDEIRVRFMRNIVKNQSFKEKINNALSKYDSRYLTTAQVIQTLLEIGDEIKNTKTSYESLGLSQKEEAFYDLLRENKDFLLSKKSTKNNDDSEVKYLLNIAKELTKYLQNKTNKIDWQDSEGFKKTLRSELKDLLRKYGVKTKEAEKIVVLIMKQTEYTFGDAFEIQELNESINLRTG